MIRAKMHCDRVEESKSTDKEGNVTKHQENIRLSAVYGKDGSSNAEWSKATPYGYIELGISNPAAFGKFQHGKFYFIDFEEAPEDG